MQNKKAVWAIAQSAYKIEAESILASLERLEQDAFNHAVQVLAEAPRIATSGCGHS